MDTELVAWRDQVGACVDSQLMAELRQLVRVDRRCEARMLVYLGEMDARELFLAQGYSSLFRFATVELRMSEAQAYLRIQAARLVRKYPVILDMLVQGELNLSTLKLLDRHLTADNHVALLERARNKAKREVELLIAEIAPRPDVPNRIRKLPVSKAGRDRAHSLAPTAREPAGYAGNLFALAKGVAEQAPRVAQQAPLEQPVVAEVADASVASVPAEVKQRVAPTFVLGAPHASFAALRPGRFRLQITAGQALHDKLKQLQHLLQHQLPGGNLAVIVERALDVLLEKTLKQRFAQVAKPRAARSPNEQSACRSQSVAAASRLDGEIAGRPNTQRLMSRSRYIPRAVLREVFARDGGQCTFTGPRGQRCSERGMLEVHHVHAFALGGESTLRNLELVCRSHNGFFANQDFGAAHMRMKREAGKRA